MEPFNFVAGNEDCCAYTFDMRRLASARNVHKDHVGAVMDVDFAPTGREFVTGSYDKTVRVFPADRGHSREVSLVKCFSDRHIAICTFLLPFAFRVYSSQSYCRYRV